MKQSLEWVASTLAVKSSQPAKNIEITGWSVDSRTLMPGDLFFALRGPSFDGHAYIEEVFRKGAAAVVAEKAAASSPIVVVKDSLRALQQLAAAARAKWGGQIIAVTGSAGKTTTKDIIATFLGQALSTSKSAGNLNNHVGLPLSLLRIPAEAQTAVLEMGMNHAGEIRDLARIAGPQVGVVTNVGWAHIENFEGREGIAAAKRELIESLGPQGIAVLNADDPIVAGFSNVHPGRSILFGISPDAEVRAIDVRYSSQGTSFQVGTTLFHTPLTGRHSVSNILAGIAVAGAFGISPDRLVDHVAQLQPAKMRGERFVYRGVLVYNDSYNSNPDAVRAMLDILRDSPARQRIAVLGEMLELGHWAEPLHRDVGSYAVECGVNVLVGIRGAACYILDEALRAGLRADAAFFFDEPEAAGRKVRSLAQEGDAVLFKGSRGVRVEAALQAFLSAEEGGAA